MLRLYCTISKRLIINSKCTNKLNKIQRCRERQPQRQTVVTAANRGASHLECKGQLDWPVAGFAANRQADEIDTGRCET